MCLRYSIVFIFVSCLCACDKSNEDTLPKNTDFELNIPDYFPAPEPLLSNNQKMTKEIVALGKKLFYDPILSGDNTISCATCHQPNLGFSDGLSLSDRGITGEQLPRHSPALINLSWSKAFFWDGGATNLESQAMAPITNKDEMGQAIPELMSELSNHDEYPGLFNEAFPDEEMDMTTIAKALAHFERTLISAGSKYDDYRKGKAKLSELELYGMKVVESKCGGCHPAPLFTDNDYHNNGLDDTYSEDNDRMEQGRLRITYIYEDMGKYKTPTLRNILKSAPYMHDGRLGRLDDVLHHYTNGVKRSPTLDPLIDTEGISLSEVQKQAILVFLETLTDEEFLEM
ncbi:cytochrome-c peroxidase [Fulvivirga maritima]|uniref:cytochrome-c peroxidase n=1 Tax=Fulvivirga maritima TaxID=2904247 RepID=UPI001F42CF06|nr:cytochrome c peroxidase [Fulvivirga maritima]UII25706.1 cytochrome-c peroxidase [Fulvivirga maritima]